MPDVGEQLVDPDVTVVDVTRSRASVRRLMADRGDILAVIAVGGALGSLARWGVGQAMPHQPGRFASSTLLINVVGALALGVLMVLEVWPPTRLVRPFFGVGVLGGFTTFSTFALDTTQSLRLGHPGTAAAYLFTTLVAGVLASWLGAVGTRAAVERGPARRRARRSAARDQEGTQR